MFVQRIGGLNKSRFGINFKAEDIKCEVNKKELFKKVKEENNKESK